MVCLECKTRCVFAGSNRHYVSENKRHPERAKASRRTSPKSATSLTKDHDPQPVFASLVRNTYTFGLGWGHQPLTTTRKPVAPTPPAIRTILHSLSAPKTGEISRYPRFPRSRHPTLRTDTPTTTLHSPTLTRHPIHLAYLSLTKGCGSGVCRFVHTIGKSQVPALTERIGDMHAERHSIQIL